jgi:hypothetical protein
MSGADNASYTIRHLTQATQQQTVSPNDSVILWESNGFAIYTLPLAAQFPGRMLSFIQVNGASGSIQIFAAGANTADGTTLSWNVGGAQAGRMTIVSDGVNGWWSTNSVNVTRV